MQGLGVGSALIWILITIAPFFLVLFRTKWLKGYFLCFCSIWIIAIFWIGLGNEKLIRKEHYWWDLFDLLAPFLSFIFWYLISKIVQRKKR